MVFGLSASNSTNSALFSVLHDGFSNSGNHFPTQEHHFPALLFNNPVLPRNRPLWESSRPAGAGCYPSPEGFNEILSAVVLVEKFLTQSRKESIVS
jgi:hypothetical protein